MIERLRFPFCIENTFAASSWPTATHQTSFVCLFSQICGDAAFPGNSAGARKKNSSSAESMPKIFWLAKEKVRFLVVIQCRMLICVRLAREEHRNRRCAKMPTLWSYYGQPVPSMRQMCSQHGSGAVRSEYFSYVWLWDHKLGKFFRCLTGGLPICLMVVLFALSTT